MKLLITFSALIACGALLVSCSAPASKSPAPGQPGTASQRETVGRVERLDPAIDKIVPPGATIERLASGFKWAEGPIWVKDRGGYLLFSDVKANTVFKWTDADGLKPHIQPSGYTGEPAGYKGIEPGSNGLTLGPDGALLLCQHGDRRVARLKLPHDPATKPAFETVVDKFEGKRFNSPNDVCCDKAGTLYFTDPPYGLPGQSDEAAEKELKVNGVYRVSKDGSVKLLTSELRRPNGIALSPDEKTLYVAQSDGSKPIIMAWDVTDDGIANGRVFFDTTPLKGKGPGGCDGMRTDAAGNIFATGPGGVMVITKEGKHLGTIRPSDTQPTANCAFGGADGTWLYMTNDSHLCRVKLNTKGKGF